MNCTSVRARRVAARLTAALAVTVTTLGVLTGVAAPASALGMGTGGPAGYNVWVTFMGTQAHGLTRTVVLDSQVLGPDGKVAPGVTAQAWTRRVGKGQPWHLAATGTTDSGGNITLRARANERSAAYFVVRVPAQGGVPGDPGEHPFRVAGVHLTRCIGVVSSRVWVTGGRPGTGSWHAQLVPGAPACARPGLPVRAAVTLQRAVRAHPWNGVWHAVVAVRHVTELVSAGTVVGHRYGEVTVTRATRTVR